MKTVNFTMGKGTSLEEAVAFLDNRNRDYVTDVPLSELKIGENENQLIYNGIGYSLTGHAANQLARYTKLPVKITALPNDLAAYNFNRMLPSTSGDVKLVTENGTNVVGLLPVKHNSVDPVELINRVSTSVDDRFKLESWWSDATGVRFRYISATEIEPRLNDVIRVGVDVYDRENSEKGLGLLGNLYRLVCLNGATTSESIGGKRPNVKLRWQTSDAQVDNLVGNFNSVVSALGNYANNFATLRNKALILDEDSDAVRLTQIKDVLSPIGLSGSNYANLVLDALAEEEDTYYGCYNAITRLGRDAADPTIKSKFENAGFKLLATTVIV